MGTFTGRAIIKKRGVEPFINIVSEYDSFIIDSNDNISPNHIILTVERYNIQIADYTWYYLNSETKEWIKLSTSISDNTYKVIPGDWNSRTFKVEVRGVKSFTTLADSITISKKLSQGDKHYTQEVRIASDKWEIPHNLNKHPSVTVINDFGREVVGDIEHVDLNNIVIHFSAEFSGVVICN